MSKYISPHEISRLRAIPLLQALDLLEIYWKKDPDFQPAKDPKTIRINAGDRELLINQVKWYDTRAKKGGGGSIDLTIHLCGIKFSDAVSRLQQAERQAVLRQAAGAQPLPGLAELAAAMSSLR